MPNYLPSVVCIWIDRWEISPKYILTQNGIAVKSDAMLFTRANEVSNIVLLKVLKLFNLLTSVSGKVSITIEYEIHSLYAR